MEKLTGDYIAGFVDGEGCFALNFRRDLRHERKNKPVYFSWKIQFSIVLRDDDVNILKRIQKTLECGDVSIDKRGYARYQVTDVNDLNNKIVPFFENNNLQAKKYLDFVLWKEAVAIIFKTKRNEVNVRKGSYGFVKTIWEPTDLDRLAKIQKELMVLRKINRSPKWEGNSAL